MACFFNRTKIMRNGSSLLFLLYSFGEGEEGCALYLYALLMGTVLGSFLRLIAVRFLLGESIIAPRSVLLLLQYTS